MDRILVSTAGRGKAASVTYADDARPRFCPDVPITWCRPGTVCLGSNPQFTVADVCAADLHWLISLRGTRTFDELRSELQAPSRRRLFDAAVHIGAIEDALAISDAWRMLPTERRARLDGDLAAYRHTYRSGLRAHAAMVGRLHVRIGIFGEGPVREALQVVAAGQDLSVVTDQPDIVILAPAQHPDALPAATWTEQAAMRGNHLMVRAFGHRGVIGPLVVPGRTACSICWHMRQRDVDPTWSLRAAQLTGFHPAVWPVDQVLAHALAAHALLLVHSWIANPDALHLWANQMRTVWMPNGTIDVESVVPHPACGCTDAPLSAMDPDP